MIDKIETGTDVLRAALYARSRKVHPGNLARDLGVSPAALDAFTNSKALLAPDVLKKLTVFLFGGSAVYDEAIDRLRPAVEAEAKPLGIHAPPFKKKPPFDNAFRPGPQPVIPVPRPPMRVARPGWIETP